MRSSTLKSQTILPSYSKSSNFPVQETQAATQFTKHTNFRTSFLNGVLATTLFRCWHILFFFAGWSTLITLLNERGIKVVMQPTLLTAAGTVLGFVVSYRTTASFERYNEGRRLWSQNILATRTMARTIWFHVPTTPPTTGQTVDEAKSRTQIEKKSVINLLEAFCVAIKHYLRGEDGIYYDDLYYLVKFLPAYSFPPSMPSIEQSLARMDRLQTTSSKSGPSVEYTQIVPSPSESYIERRQPTTEPSFTTLMQRNGHVGGLPQQDLPVPHGSVGRKGTYLSAHASSVAGGDRSQESKREERMVLSLEEEKNLMPAYKPPKWGLLDVILFPAMVEFMTRRGVEMNGRRAGRIRARIGSQRSHSLPLEISLYIARIYIFGTSSSSSYIATLQSRKICDVPTTNLLFASLNQLVESLTGLERILTTPIPLSYSTHLWSITTIYCLALPFQIYATLKWLTIPSTIVVSFIFFGFLVAGEEIEDPFGYDANDLNLDHFTHDIIRNELRAVTSAPPPDPESWAFAPENNLVFANNLASEVRQTPEEWMKKGSEAMQRSLSLF